MAYNENLSANKKGEPLDFQKFNDLLKKIDADLSLNQATSKESTKSFIGFSTDIVQYMKTFVENKNKEGGNKDAEPNENYISAYMSLVDPASKFGITLPSIDSIIKSTDASKKLTSLAKKIQSIAKTEFKKPTGETPNSPTSSGPVTPGNGLNLTLNFNDTIKNFSNNLQQASVLLKPFSDFLIATNNLSDLIKDKEKFQGNLEILQSVSKMIGIISGVFNGRPIEQKGIDAIQTLMNLPLKSIIEKFTNLFDSIKFNNKTDFVAIDKIFRLVQTFTSMLSGFSKKLVSEYPFFVIATSLPYGKRLSKFIESINKNLSTEFENDIINDNIESLSDFVSLLMNFDYDLVKNFPAFVIATKLPYGLLMGKFINNFNYYVGKGISNDVILSLDSMVNLLGTFNKDMLRTYRNLLIITILNPAFLIKQIFDQFAKNFKTIQSSYYSYFSAIVEMTKRMDEIIANMFTAFSVKRMMLLYFGLKFLPGINKILEKELPKLFLSIADVAKTFPESQWKIDPKTGAFIQMSGFLRSLEGLSTQIAKIKSESKGISTIIATLNFFVSGMNMIFRKMSNKSFRAVVGVQTMITSLKGIGESIMIAAGALLFIPAALLTLLFVPLIVKVMNKLGDTKTLKDVKMGKVSIGWIAKGLAQLALAFIAMSVAAMLVNPVSVLMMLTLTGATLGLFMLVGKGEKQIKEGAKGLALVSLALGIFAVTIGVYSLIIEKFTSSGALWTGLAYLVAFSGAVLLIGYLNSQGKGGGSYLNKGATGLMLIGAALIVFSIGLSVLALAVSLWKPDMLLMATVLLIGISGIVFVLGILEKSGHTVLWGALALAAIGGALIVFSIGLLIFSAAIDKWDWKTVGIALTVIAGISAIAVLLGLVATATVGAVFLGPLFLATTGLALAAFGWGLSVFGKSLLLWDTKMIDSAIEIIKRIGVAISVLGLAIVPITLGVAALILISGGLLVFSLALNALGIGLMKMSSIPFTDDSKKQSLVNIMNGVVAVAKIIVANTWLFTKALPGIYSLKQLGEALQTVGKGMRFASEISLMKFNAKQFESVITTIGKSFGLIGGMVSDGSGIFKNLGPLAYIGPNNIKSGIKSMMMSGDALISVAKGLKVFNGVANTLNLEAKKTAAGWTPAAGSLGEKIAVVLSVITKLFAEIGSSKNSGMSLTKAIFGNDFKKSDVQAGIKSVLDVGKALDSVSTGLLKFHLKTMLLDLSEKGPIIRNIGRVIGAIHNVFSKIGANKDASYFKTIFGADFGKTNTEKGINAVKNVGKILSDIAASLKTYQNLKDVWKSTDKIEYTILKLMGVLNRVFNSKTYDLDDIADGMETLTGITLNLNKVTEQFKQFTNITKQLNGWEKGFSNFKFLLYDSMVRVAAIGGNSYAWKKVYSTFGDSPFNGYFYETGAKNMELIGVGMMKFSGQMKKFSIEKLDLNNLNNIVKFVKEMSKLLNPLEKMASSFKIMADSLYKISKDEKVLSKIVGVQGNSGSYEIKSKNLDSNKKSKSLTFSAEAKSEMGKGTTIINHVYHSKDEKDEKNTKPVSKSSNDISQLEINKLQYAMLMKMSDYLEGIERNTKKF